MASSIPVSSTRTKVTRAQEDERRKDHQREEAEVVHRAASLKDECERDEARGEAAQIDRRSTQALGDRSGSGALQREVFRREHGQESASITNVRLHRRERMSVGSAAQSRAQRRGTRCQKRVRRSATDGWITRLAEHARSGP